MTPSQFDTAQIRKKLDLAFDDSELDAFCFDYFREVYHKFGQGMGKHEKIQSLLDYCSRRKSGFEALLENIRKEYAYLAEPGKTSSLKNQHLLPLIDALEEASKDGDKETNDLPPIHPKPKEGQTSSPTQFPSWAIAVGGVIVLLVGIFLGSMFGSPNPESTSEAAVQPTEAPIVTNTPIPPSPIPPSPIPPSPTNSPIPPSPIPPSPTNSPIPPSPIPTLGIGSTTISKKDQMTLLYVPEGDFEMGAADNDSNAADNEKPRHTVFLEAYWIDQTEVTNEMYRGCVEADVCGPPEVNESYSRESYYDNPEYNNYPVIYVSWDDATAYCQWVDRRLPTEAEWEKAARGTDGRKYPWGDEAPTDGLANFNGDVGDTTEVGSYSNRASPYGALDMAGNVWEWVNDWYDADYYATSPRNSPEGPSIEGEYRVLRGGSWDDEARWLRGSSRGWEVASVRLDLLGFRCAVSDS